MSAELQALAMQASQIDGEQAAASPEAIQAAQEEQAAMGLAEQNAGAVAMILGTAVPILSKLYPSLADVYTEDACQSIVASVSPVLAKHGVDLSQWGGAYKEEIGAAMVCVPIAWATVQAVKHDVEAREAAKQPQAIGQQKTAAQQRALVPGDYGYVEPDANQSIQ
ncbi:hypothetical protein GTP23_12085 [Pseudoduganella sp. FT93W]|uniref:Uncharacterized protein n=1 Tax=Duganella fentianensis TaxID=2692177 RepID=A0A845I3J3_9BURK|nr:hypothetical protein [Duganella fentianensis]MYN45786.1 hypothetical protein [Duganella fentianensis]